LNASFDCDTGAPMVNLGGFQLQAVQLAGFSSGPNYLRKDNMKFIRLAASLALMFLALLPEASAQMMSGQITGRLADPAGRCRRRQSPLTKRPEAR